MTSLARVLTAATAATALLAPAAYGAPGRPQVRDAKGDVRGGMAELDIVTTQWSTSGRGESKALVATMTLAAPPKQEAPFSYHAFADVRDCGSVSFSYAAGAVETMRSGHPADFWASCDGGVLNSVVTVTVKGNTLTWSVPVSALPEQVQPGAVFSRFESIADVGEPLFGYSFTGQADESLDYASGAAVWRMP